jgi:hypothetical protein
VIDFHGACTYAFKGIFAWQMYSAVDAVDEFGKAYTVSLHIVVVVMSWCFAVLLCITFPVVDMLIGPYCL